MCCIILPLVVLLYYSEQIGWIVSTAGIVEINRGNTNLNFNAELEEN